MIINAPGLKCSRSLNLMEEDVRADLVVFLDVAFCVSGSGDDRSIRRDLRGGAFAAGIALCWAGRRLTLTRSLADARNLLKATVLYLPVLFALIILDVTF